MLQFFRKLHACSIPSFSGRNFDAHEGRSSLPLPCLLDGGVTPRPAAPGFRGRARAACASLFPETPSLLDQRRFSRPNTHFAAFFKIYKKIIFSQANLQNFCKILENLAKISAAKKKILQKSCKDLAIFYGFLQSFAKSCRV